MAQKFYKPLMNSILRALDEYPDLSYNCLYRCVKFTAECQQKVTSCEFYEEGGACSQLRGFCEFFTKNGDCSNSRKCRYHIKDKSCLQSRQLCTHCKITKTYSKTTFSKHLNYLCSTGDIKRTGSEFVNGHDLVSFSLNAHILYLDNEFDEELSQDETLVLSVPSGLGPNEFRDRIITKYAPTGQLQIEERKTPFDTRQPPLIYLYIKTTNQSIFEFKKSIYVNREISVKLLKEVAYQSPFGFEEQHYENIINVVVRILYDLIAYLHIYSQEQEQKSSLRQYTATIENFFYYRFSLLKLLVKRPLTMSKETCSLIDRCFDYAYAVAILSDEGQIINAYDESKKVMNEFRAVDIYSRLNYMELVGNITKIISPSNPMQYNDLYQTLNAEAGTTISKTIFERCLKFLDSSGLVTRRPVSGCGRGKHIQISMSNVPTEIEDYHWRLIWAQINSVLQKVVSELYTYSNERNQLAADNRYNRFLKNQLIPSLIDLSKLVSPLTMSAYTRYTLSELPYNVAHATKYETVKHPFNNLTLAEETQILNRLEGVNLPSTPERKYPNLCPENIKYIQLRKRAAELLSKIRENQSTINQKPKVGKNRGRPKKPLSDGERALIDQVYSEHQVGARTLAKIIENEYNQEISHNRIRKYLASGNKNLHQRGNEEKENTQ